MIIKTFVQIIFYGLMLLLALFSVLMIYVLIRFGESKILGFIISSLYILLLVSLYAAASVNFEAIPFPEFEL